MTTPIQVEDDRQLRRRSDETLLMRHAATRDPALRERLVERYLPLAHHVARGYASGSEPYEDLVQVASLGLLKAIDRYEPQRGCAFSTYAVPTITGEIQRHFRDRTWIVRPPRDLQDRSLAVERAIERLGADGRRPTVQEIAEATGLELEEVLEARQAATARDGISLTAPRGGDGDGGTLADRLGMPDEGLVRAEARVMVQGMTATLTRREREVVRLRFEQDLTQAEIAAEIGVSQMQVSRILRHALAKLHALHGEPANERPGAAETARRGAPR